MALRLNALRFIGLEVDTEWESSWHELESATMNSHEGLQRTRKKRRRSRKLSANRELMASVIIMVICGLFVIGLLTYLLSTRGCQLPRFLQSQNTTE